MPTYYGTNTTVKLRVWDPSTPWTTGLKGDGVAAKKKSLEARIENIRASKMEPVKYGPAKGFVYEDLIEE